jgi:hypothetical protein
MTDKIYFVYDDDDGYLYYYDQDTKECTYERPASGHLMDPNTKLHYKFPHRRSHSSKKSKDSTNSNQSNEPQLLPVLRRPSNVAKLAASSAELRRTIVIDIPAPILNYDEVAVLSKSGASSANHSSILPDAGALALPAEVSDAIHKFQVSDYANQFFRVHRQGHVFARKQVSMDALTTWQKEPLSAPLLQVHTKASQKLAIDAFKLILAYTSPTGTAAQASRIIDMMAGCPEVRDEIYFQLIKQTRSNPDRDCQIKTWQLFVIVASLIPSTRNSEDWIKSHVSRHISSESPEISELAQFTYIRFSATCAKGKVVPNVTQKMLQMIPQEVDKGTQWFGVSLYEQLFHQRTTHPHCPFPRILHVMTEKLFEKGIESVEGVFRIPGNGKVILQLEEAVNTGDLTLDGDVHDVGSLFKSWFAKLPEPIVGAEMLGALKTTFETKEYAQFVTQLPKAHQITLRYLIGFLQRMIKFQEVTRMGAKNYAMVFSPNLVALDNIKDPLQIARYAEMIQEFVASLIGSWNTSDVYPPPPEFFTA